MKKTITIELEDSAKNLIFVGTKACLSLEIEKLPNVGGITLFKDKVKAIIVS